MLGTQLGPGRCCANREARRLDQGLSDWAISAFELLADGIAAKVYPAPVPKPARFGIGDRI